MKTARLLAAAFVACASLPLTMAQQVGATAQENASASAAGMRTNESAGATANAGHDRADAKGAADSSLTAKSDRHDDASAYSSAEGAAKMRPVTGQLEGKLDSKTAKPGDKVFLKTTEKTKTAEGVVIPRGSRLVGHVTDVQEHAKGHQESHIGLEFDRVELKNGQSMAIHSMIESVQPGAAMAAGSMDDDAMLSAPMGGGSAMVGGASHGGGGLLGGAGGAVGAVGHAGSGLESSTGSAVGAAGSLSGDATGSVGHGLNATAGSAGSLGARATGVPGVMLNGDAAGSASGTLSATNRNIHLDSGTEMVLGVAAAR